VGRTIKGTVGLLSAQPNLPSNPSCSGLTGASRGFVRSEKTTTLNTPVKPEYDGKGNGKTGLFSPLWKKGALGRFHRQSKS
jgi:hypothetical protein